MKVILNREEIDIEFINQLLQRKCAFELYLEENDSEVGVSEKRTLLIERYVDSVFMDDGTLKPDLITWWNSGKWEELDIEIDYSEGKLKCEERLCHECGKLLGPNEGFQTQSDGVVCDYCRENYDDEGRFLW